MNKCLECGAEVTQTEGKRKKQYCGNTCRVKFYLKKKNEGKPKGKRGRPKGSKNKFKKPFISDKDLIDIAKNATKKIKKIIDTPEINEPMQQSFNDLIIKNISVIKTELVDGNIKITNNPKLTEKELARIALQNELDNL